MSILNSHIVWIIFVIIILITMLINFFLKKKYFNKLNILKQSYYLIMIWLFSFFIFIISLWVYSLYFFNVHYSNASIKYFVMGFGIEQLLSLDNVVMWFIIFKYFNVSILLQKKVLNYGIYVAFPLRIILIILNYWFFLHWHWIIFIFGVILFFSGLEMLSFSQDSQSNIQENLFFLCIKKIFRVSNDFNQSKFFIVKNGLLYITYLFITLLMIEVSDIIFAIDSIPVVLSFINNPSVIIISNIFSILALREFYFIFSNILYKNFYLKFFISFLILLISMKIMLENYSFILNNIFLMLITVSLILFLSYKMFLKKLLNYVFN